MVFGMNGGGHPFYKIQDKRGLPAVSVGGQFYLPCCDANGIKRAPSPSRQARGDRDFKATTKEWSEERYPATQRQQSVTKYIDESGNVVAAYVYGDFGETLERSGPMADVFPHRFSTKYHDGETGLYYYGYRFYNPALKRWMNRDPIGEEGGVNLYGFCGNNGASQIDSLGENVSNLEILHNGKANVADNKYLDFLRRINCHSARRRNEAYRAIRRLTTTQQMAI